MSGWIFASKEINMCVVQNKERGGYFFIAAGCAFLLTAVVGNQTAFYGLGAMYLAMGASYLRGAGDA